LKANWRFGRIFHNHLQGQMISQALLATRFMLISCLAYFLTMKMEAKCSFDMSVDIQQTTRCYIPKCRTFHNHLREHLKKKNSVAFIPQANYTDRQSDRRLWAKLVPTFADRGCRVVSTTDPPG
jgi:hypothetical protein